MDVIYRILSLDVVHAKSKTTASKPDAGAEQPDTAAEAPSHLETHKGRAEVQS